MVLPTDFLLEFSDFLREKFHRTAASGAHHVMVAAAVVLMFVARNSIVKRDFTGKSALGQKLQRPVNRCVTNARIFLLHQAVQFVGGKMVTGFQESAQNRVALRGLLKSDALEMAVQDLLCLANHLTRESGLIIDALLQHGVVASQDTTLAY